MMSIEYDGKIYPSLSQFTTAYGLNYTAVYKQLQLGRTLEEIVARQNLTDINTNSNPSIYKNACEYNGKRYKTIADAARDLGFSAHKAYFMKKEWNCTASETVAYMMAKKNGGPMNGENLEIEETSRARNIPVTINGVTYPTRNSALEAFNIPRITADARMKRNGMTFEEAILLGPASNKRIQPVCSSFSEENLTPWKDFDIKTLPIIKQNILKRLIRKYDVEPYIIDENTSAFKFKEPFNSQKYITTCWMIFYYSQIEMLVTDFVLESFKNSLDPPYKTINNLNIRFNGPQIYLADSSITEEHSICLRTTLLAKKISWISVPLLFSNFDNLLGVCEVIAREY